MRLLDGEQLKEAVSSLGCEVTGAFAYEAVCDGERLGLCAFDIRAGLGMLYGVSVTDAGGFMIADGLIRAALSLMQRRGAVEALCGGGVDERLLRGTGFRQTEGAWRVSLDENLFSGCGH